MAGGGRGRPGISSTKLNYNSCHLILYHLHYKNSTSTSSLFPFSEETSHTGMDHWHFFFFFRRNVEKSFGHLGFRLERRWDSLIRPSENGSSLEVFSCFFFIYFYFFVDVYFFFLFLSIIFRFFASIILRTVYFYYLPFEVIPLREISSIFLPPI